MYYVCGDCGNTTLFDGNQKYTEWGTEQITIGGDGDIIDWNDREANDEEVTEGPDDLECRECNSSNIEEYGDEDERDERQVEVENENQEEPEPVKKNWKKELGGA